MSPPKLTLQRSNTLQSIPSLKHKRTVEVNSLLNFPNQDSFNESKSAMRSEMSIQNSAAISKVQTNQTKGSVYTIMRNKNNKLDDNISNYSMRTNFMVKRSQFNLNMKARDNESDSFEKSS
jgi:hypothetical protein